MERAEELPWEFIVWKQFGHNLRRMKIIRLCSVALCLALSCAYAPAARAQSLCSKLTEDEVSSAVGVQLRRSPTDPCRFGRALQSFTIIIHSGDGPRFGEYANQARQEFKDVQTVPGIGSAAIFYGFNLAVQAKGDVIVVQMLMGHSPAEKIGLSKAVVARLIQHY
jgi:hypothetical protein